MSDFAQPERCATDRRDLRWRIAHWREAEPGMAYEHVGACSDREACRARVLAQKKPWPLVDATEARASA